MTKEELEKEAVEYCANNCGDCYGCHKKYRKNKNCEKIKSMIKTYLASAEPREKRIAELEEKISVLLSCKNCPENKGGLICEKEYENKCLAQKIQYIKELQEENAELKAFKKKCKFNVSDICKEIETENNLIKAKDLLLRFIELKDKPCAVGHSVNMLLYENISADAKQFLEENK